MQDILLGVMKTLSAQLRAIESRLFTTPNKKHIWEN